MAAQKHPHSGNTGRASKKSKNKTGRIVLFIFEIVVLLVLLLVLFFVLKGTGSVQKIRIEEEDLIMNEQVAELESMKGYRNIALFGVDARNGALGKGTRSDTIMVASINQDTGDIRIVSVYRDSFMNLGNDSYNKCNAAYAKGGPEQAINMLNMNLDMNITDYVTVGFLGMVETIDALGGVEIDIKQDEISHLNNYQQCIAEDLDREDYTKITSTGKQKLNGIQATAYCRIRYTAGDDFKRAERQRNVLMAIAEKAKQASPATLTAAAESIFPNIATSLDIQEILEVLGEIFKYNIVGNDGFPFEEIRGTATLGSKGSCVVPLTLEDNVVRLHKFLFNETDYTPSAEVKEYSLKIAGEAAKYVKK